MSNIFQGVGNVVESLVGGLFGGTERPTAAPAPTPTPEPVTRMPVANDATAAAQRRRSIADQLRRRGRAATILTDVNNTTETLGG